MDNEAVESFLKQGALISLNQEMVLIGYGEITWLRKPQLKTPLFYFPDFFLTSEKPWLHFQHTAILTLHQLTVFLEKLGLSECLLKKNVWNEPDKEIFKSEFHKLQKLFVACQLKKAVPYVSMTTSNPDAFNLINSLLNALKKANSVKGMYVYGFWTDLEGMIGLTPELFLSCKKDKDWIVETMACAGTIKNFENEDLIKKTLKEHQLVIEGIEKSLKSFGDVMIKETNLIDYLFFKHYVTEITVNTHQEELELESIISALHPTPALGVYPKKEGFSWLREYDDLIRRERYGAPVGCWIEEGGKFLSYVAIRNLQWKNKEYSITAGCGVVKESILEEEWQEIGLKFQAIRESLAL